jgi:hypothetical protein
LEEDPSVMAYLKAMHDQMMESGTLEKVHETVYETEIDSE